MAVISSRPLGKNPLSVTSLGLGTAPLANLYRPIPEGQAIELIQFAFEQGIRLFDTAPLYGFGLSEERVGKALAGIPRNQFVISTKIGRLPHADRGGQDFDYSRAGVLRSLEGSLKRLGVAAVDILHIHEPDENAQAALEMAFPTLADLRSQGVIKAIGAGMNQWQVLMPFIRNAVHNTDFDCFRSAGRYTLLEQTSLEFLHLCQARGIGILLGGVYNSGILATGPQPAAKYNYADAPADVLAKAVAIQAICEPYQVALNVAALHFAQAHPAVTTLVVGAESKAEITANLRALQSPVPSELWAALRQAGLITADAP